MTAPVVSQRPPERATPPTVHDEAPPLAVEPPPALELFLLATVTGAHPLAGKATIRDARHGRITSLAPGDALRPDVVLLEVHTDRVLLGVGGWPRPLMFGEHPVVLHPDDILYPDLDLGANELSDAMADAVPLPEGPYHDLKRPHLAWGTPRTVATLLRAFDRYRQRVGDAPKIHVGDLSARHGGPLPPHVSHRAGRDVDIGYVLHGRRADRHDFSTPSRGDLDLARTWALLRALLDTNAVAYVFVDYELQGDLYGYASDQGEPPERLKTWFQYPRGARASVGVIRHWPGHRGHFHVRFLEREAATPD